MKGEVDDSKEKGKEETAQNAAPQEKRGVQKAALAEGLSIGNDDSLIDRTAMKREGVREVKENEEDNGEQKQVRNVGFLWSARIPSSVVVDDGRFIEH